MRQTGRSIPRREGQLPEALFDRLFSGCAIERYAVDQHVFLQDDKSDRLFGIVSGTIEISHYSPSGRKLVANVESSHSLVGEVGALDGGIRTATATCLTDCELYSVSRAQLIGRIEADPQVALGLIQLLCSRVRWISTEFGDQVLLKVDARLAKRLLFLAYMLARGDDWITISQTELAEFLGTTRESVNKTMTAWKAQKLIDVRRGGVRIADLARLKDLASGN